MLTDNVFKKIVDGQIPTTLLHDDDLVLAFKDIHPQAKIHILIIPKKEIRTHADLTAEDLPIIARMHQVAQKLANDFGLKYKDIQDKFLITLEESYSVAEENVSSCINEKLEDLRKGLT